MARRTTIKNAEAVVKLERSAIEPLFDKFMKAKKVSNVSNYTLIYYQNGYNFFIKRNGIKFVEEITEDRVIDIIYYLCNIIIKCRKRDLNPHDIAITRT